MQIKTEKPHSYEEYTLKTNFGGRKETVYYSKSVSESKVSFSNIRDQNDNRLYCTKSGERKIIQESYTKQRKKTFYIRDILGHEITEKVHTT